MVCLCCEREEMPRSAVLCQSNLQIFLLLAPCSVITRRPITYRLPGMAWNFK